MTSLLLLRNQQNETGIMKKNRLNAMNYWHEEPCVGRPTCFSLTRQVPGLSVGVYGWYSDGVGGVRGQLLQSDCVLLPTNLSLQREGILPLKKNMLSDDWVLFTSGLICQGNWRDERRLREFSYQLWSKASHYSSVATNKPQAHAKSWLSVIRTFCFQAYSSKVILLFNHVSTLDKVIKPDETLR